MFRSLAKSFKRFLQPARRPYRKPQRTQLTLEALESREMLDGALSSTLTAIGADAGGAPRVQVHNADGSLRHDFLAYDAAFTGGVHVAVGDVNGDGMQDIITGTGAGAGPHVRVFDGVTGQVMRDFFAYSPLFTGGITVASADVNADGFDDIITGAGPSGGPHVQVFSGRDGSNLASFFAYDPSFSLGINIAAGDVNGDGFADIITAPQTGGGPHVKVFSGQNSSEMANFFAYNPSFTGGVYVAAGDVNGDGFADIVTGAGANGGPHVKVYSGAGITNGGEPETLRDFFAYAPTFLPGVRVATTDHNNDGYADILTGAGPGGGPHVKVFDGQTNNELENFFAFEPSFTGGLFAGGNPNVVGGDHNTGSAEVTASNEPKSVSPSFPVSAINQAPIIGPIDDQIIGHNEILTIPLSASDADGDRLVFSARTVSENGDAVELPVALDVVRGELYIETATYSGTFHVQVTATDGSASNTVSFEVNALEADGKRAVLVGHEIPDVTVMPGTEVREGETVHVHVQMQSSGDRVSFGEVRRVFGDALLIDISVESPLNYATVGPVRNDGQTFTLGGDSTPPLITFGPTQFTSHEYRIDDLDAGDYRVLIRVNGKTTEPVEFSVTTSPAKTQSASAWPGLEDIGRGIGGEVGFLGADQVKEVGAILINGTFWGTGTLLHSGASKSQWVLTSAHVAEDALANPGALNFWTNVTNPAVMFGGTPHQGNAIFIHPQFPLGQEEYSEDHEKVDLALIRLQNPVNGIRGLDIARQPMLEGQRVARVGFGPSSKDGRDYAKRFGMTQIDEVNAYTLEYELDVNDIHGGDSGGPNLVREMWYYGPNTVIAAINTSSHFGDPLGLFGSDHDVSTRIDVHANWIDSTMRDNPPPSSGGSPSPIVVLPPGSGRCDGLCFH